MTGLLIAAFFAATATLVAWAIVSTWRAYGLAALGLRDALRRTEASRSFVWTRRELTVQRPSATVRYLPLRTPRPRFEQVLRAAA